MNGFVADVTEQRDEIRARAKCLSLMWAKWLRKRGQPVDRARREQLELQLDELLRKYRDQWGLNVLEIRWSGAANDEPARRCGAGESAL